MKQVFSLNSDWKYRLVKTDEVSFDVYTKTGEMNGPMSSSFSDADWQAVSLPHDWCVEMPFDPNGAQGFKKKGAAIYRRCFNAEESWQNKRIFLRFDGIAARSAIVLNDMLIAHCDSGYLPISTEITALLHFGQPNTIAVLTDNERREGWWYDGGGINRSVFLTVSEESRFAENGVFVSASKGTNDLWQVNVRAEVDRVLPGQTITVEVMGEKAETLASSTASLTLSVSNPPLWSMDSPALVPVTIRLKDSAGEIIDEEIIPFGFREITFDAEHGCLLNGQSVKLKGVCLHGDHAGVGSAIPYELHLFRLRRLKEMGANAIRTSHNPQSPDFYRACDEVGFAVMNETRHFGASDDNLNELRTFVRRDRNHPCVFFWSLYNEEPLQCTRMGEAIARAMKRVVMEEDGTRPVSGGMNGAIECEGVVKVVDITGINYMQQGYDEFHALHPDMPVFGSETVSWLTQRGETETGVFGDRLLRGAFGRKELRVLGDITNLYPWSALPGATWREIEKRPFMAGCFAWTGIDYRGEAIWPSVLSDFGAMDLCCFPKDAYKWYRALWQKNILDARRYVTKDGVKALVYTDGDSIVLRQEGRDDLILANDPYDPQPISIDAAKDAEITAFKNGQAIASTSLKIPKNGCQLKLICESDAPVPGGATPFNVFLTDENGTLCDCDDEVSFSAEGGMILGTGNGDSSSHAEDRSSRIELYHGCAQVIIRANASTLTVCASCGNLTARCEIAVPPAKVTELPACEPWLRIPSWRMSDITETPPHHDQIHDMRYNWMPTAVASEECLIMRNKVGFVSFAAEFDAPNHPCTIHLENVSAHFDLYMDGEVIISCRNDDSKTYAIPLPTEKQGQRVKLSFLFLLHGKRVRIGETYLM